MSQMNSTNHIRTPFMGAFDHRAGAFQDDDGSQSYLEQNHFEAGQNMIRLDQKHKAHNRGYNTNTAYNNYWPEQNQNKDLQRLGVTPYMFNRKTSKLS